METQTRLRCFGAAEGSVREQELVALSPVASSAIETWALGRFLVPRSSLTGVECQIQGFLKVSKLSVDFCEEAAF